MTADNPQPRSPWAPSAPQAGGMRYLLLLNNGLFHAAMRLSCFQMLLPASRYIAASGSRGRRHSPAWRRSAMPSRLRSARPGSGLNGIDAPSLDQLCLTSGRALDLRRGPRAMN